MNVTTEQFINIEKLCNNYLGYSSLNGEWPMVLVHANDHILYYITVYLIKAVFLKLSKKDPKCLIETNKNVQLNYK